MRSPLVYAGLSSSAGQNTLSRWVKGTTCSGAAAAGGLGGACDEGAAAAGLFLRALLLFFLPGASVLVSGSTSGGLADPAAAVASGTVSCGKTHSLTCLSSRKRTNTG